MVVTGILIDAVVGGKIGDFRCGRWWRHPKEEYGCGCLRDDWLSTCWACEPPSGSSSGNKLCGSDYVASISRQTYNRFISLRWWVMRINGKVRFIAAPGADCLCPSWDSWPEPWVSSFSRCVEACENGDRSWMLNSWRDKSANVRIWSGKKGKMTIWG